ncbi:MAG: hypothetical protein KDC90_05005 [Ignavibacteriae bacterium]|nr:hypothetical protein [Ignavibacteriota bacterium]
MKKIYMYAIAVLMFANTIFGQFNAGASGIILFPQGEFKQNIGENGYGISFNGSYKFKGTPFSLGLNTGWARYGSETRTETLIWPVRVDVTTGNDIYFAQLFSRIELDAGFIKPYGEILFGFNYLNTNTEISDVDVFGFDDIASDTQFDDINLSYGFAAGAMIKIYDYKGGNDYLDKLFFDFRMSYMQGGNAEYLKEGDLIKGANNEILFNKSQSAIDYVTINVGLSFQFNAQ